MIEYIIISAACCFIGEQITNYSIKKRMEKHGYVTIKKTSPTTTKEKIKGYIPFFIPGLTNIIGFTYLLGTGLMIFGSDDFIEDVFEKNSNTQKASVAYGIYQEREKRNNFKSIEESLLIDGADEPTIKKEIEGAKKEVGIISTKEMKKIQAQSDAELFLNEISQCIELTDKERKELYPEYVKEFQSKNPKPKALVKTLKIADNKKQVS